MRSVKNNTIFALLVVSVCFSLLGYRVGAADAIVAKRYSGVEVNNLVDVVNNHATMLLQIQNDLDVIVNGLNFDGGVSATSFTVTNPNANTILTLDRR